VSVGCFQETSFNSAVVDSLPEAWTEAAGGISVSLVAVDSSDPAVYVQSYQLSDLVTFSSNIDGCGASAVQMCTDVACTTPSVFASDLASLETNPILKDSDGHIAPEI